MVPGDQLVQNAGTDNTQTMQAVKGTEKAIGKAKGQEFVGKRVIRKDGRQRRASRASSNPNATDVGVNVGYVSWCPRSSLSSALRRIMVMAVSFDSHTVNFQGVESSWEAIRARKRPARNATRYVEGKGEMGRRSAQLLPRSNPVYRINVRWGFQQSIAVGCLTRRPTGLPKKIWLPGSRHATLRE